MFTRGEVTGIIRGETSTGKPFQVITVLEREGGEARLVRVKDYSMKIRAEKGKQIQINVFVSGWKSKDGSKCGVNIVASKSQEFSEQKPGMRVAAV